MYSLHRSRRYGLPLFRLFTSLSLALCLLTARAQQNSYQPIRTPQNITANRILPKNALPYGQAIPVSFSSEPKDEEFFRVSFFEEPLLPANIAAKPGENQALLYSLASYSQRSSPNDFSSILGFLQNYPDSRWRGSLLAGLGIVYRRTGYYSKALDVWLESWRLLKDQEEPRLKALADRVLSELLLIYAWVGRPQNIDSLLNETSARIVGGPATERIISVKEGLWLMKNNPGISFNCGPIALNRLYSLQDSLHRFNEFLSSVQSTEKGFSLLDLAEMARTAGLDYQMAFRQPGAEVIPNSVVHWKLDHYSALISFDSGSYKCEDATVGSIYGQQFWLTPDALDSSASGYFLVPVQPLPQGWRSVSPVEARNVYGKGQVPTDDRGKNNGDNDPQLPECDNRTPMAQSNVHSATISLHIFDRPLYYTPPKGPAMFWDVDYHQRDSYQPANFNYSNFGPKWTFQWLSYVQDNPNSPSANVDVYLMGGGVRTFTGYNAVTKSFGPELRSKDVLVRICDNCYEIRHSDGSREVYERPNGGTSAGRKIFLTRVIDPAGNEMKISYDANLRIIALQDAIGQVTTLSYELPTDIYKITKVTDPFGRSAIFEFDIQLRLTRITDMIGIVSSFRYSGADFIDQLTTPYGVTSFIKADGPANRRMLETQYPLGEKERVEFAERANGVKFTETIFPSTSVIDLYNTNLYYRNTFYWDRKAMNEAPGDYTKARIYHWLHGSNTTAENGFITPMLESIQMPNENRVWFNYQGQTAPQSANAGMSAIPSITGRVLDDNTSQFTKATFNALDKVTSSIDALNRRLSFTYAANNIDLLEIRQTTGTANELLAKYVYNSQHLPTRITDASGMVTSMSYSASGQLTEVTNARNETTRFDYNGNGYLTGITGPTQAKTIISYDGYGRPRTITDEEGYSVTTDYDALDRPTLITYPDGSFEQIVYEKLDAVHFRDRLGRWSHTVYDSLQRPVIVKDALSRITRFAWCNCGSIERITDPLNRITTFKRDLQGRIIEKIFPDGRKNLYEYEKTTSRLLSVTDAKGQKTRYSYFIDDKLRQIVYSNAVIPTGSVSLTYDANYGRLSSLTDTTGRTSYTYYPVSLTPALGAGLLSSVDAPLANDVITYTYDSLNRRNGRSINGVTSTSKYDSAGRVIEETNALGRFVYTYVNQTERIKSILFPNGQITAFDYFGNTEDQRLKQIWNKTTYGNTLSKFDYTYNAAGQITTWSQQLGGNPVKTYEFAYDSVDQLNSVMQRSAQLPVSITQYAYRYDSASNRLMENTATSVTSSRYNNLNQLIQQIRTDTSRNAGGLPVNTPNTNINSISYDANGNTTSTTSPAVTYFWDAADHLVKIVQGGNTTEFIYDGIGRRVAEKLNGVIVKTFLWDGAELVEERNATGAITIKRFFSQGEQIGGVPYYFTKDHLGSTREMTDAAGTVKARYDYSPYGKRTRIAGTMDADFGFTGHYFHAPTGLYLALYRAYDVNSGRWLNRDPIEEQGGLNLYVYVENNPISRIDFRGDDWVKDAGNLFIGIGDGVSFGITERIRNWLGTDQYVNKCDQFYQLGQVSGKIIGAIVWPKLIRSSWGAWKAWRAVEKEKNVIPEGKLANHLFKGNDKLADNPDNRKLIQEISNGKPVLVDRFGKSWYRGVDASGKGIYTYTRNGIVKGAGYTDLSADELVAKIVKNNAYEISERW